MQIKLIHIKQLVSAECSLDIMLNPHTHSNVSRLRKYLWHDTVLLEEICMSIDDTGIECLLRKQIISPHTGTQVSRAPLNTPEVTENLLTPSIASLSDDNLSF